MTLAIDFETALIQPGLQIPPPVCISWDRGAGGEVSKDWVPVLREALHGDSQIVGLNMAYDMLVACEADYNLIAPIFAAYDADRVTDVAIRQKLIDIALGEYMQHGPYSLQNLAKRLLDTDVAKEDSWRRRYWELVSVPIDEWPQEAIDYSRKDAEITLQIYRAQEDDLAEIGRLCVLADQYRQARADLILQATSAWGLRTDEDGVKRLEKACLEEQADLEELLFDAGLLRRKKDGTIAKRKLEAQKRMWIVNPLGKLTPTGKKKNAREVKYISVDAEACADSGDPTLEAFSRYSQLGNLLSGHVKHMYEGLVTPIHTRFEVLKETGRTGSSKPNVQNIRRAPGARECFIPREGYVFVGCDFDKAELHTLAQVCINLFGQSALAETLNTGIDPHIQLGARLAGVTYDELKAACKDGDKEAKEWRRRAKPGNFGFPGGMGAAGMQNYAKTSYGVVMTLDESRDLYGGWQDTYPVEAYQYLGWIRNLVGDHGYTTIEHFGSGRWRGKVPYCTAANSFFQGMSADGMKAALWEVGKKCYLPGTALFGCRIVNQVHDEIIIEAPLDRYAAAATELRDTMVKAYNTYTKDVPVSASPVAMDRWSKSAEPSYDADGNLEIWRYQYAA